MKSKCVITIIVACALIISGCSQNYKTVKNIVITIDPNKREDKYQVINIVNKDSINIFMKKLDDRKRELWKSYPTFTIEINYAEKTEKYLGNGNHIKDAKDGRTYKILAKDWELFNY